MWVSLRAELDCLHKYIHIICAYIHMYVYIYVISDSQKIVVF